MLHYYAKDFFSPIIISPFEFNNTLYIFFVSDLLQVSCAVDSGTTLQTFLQEIDKHIPTPLPANSFAKRRKIFQAI